MSRGTLQDLAPHRLADDVGSVREVSLPEAATDDRDLLGARSGRSVYSARSATRGSTKDLEVLDDRVSEGRFTVGLVNWIRELGAELTVELDAGRHWWDPRWAHWTPPKSWNHVRLPPDWRSAP